MSSAATMPPEPEDHGIRPLVARQPSNRGLWLFAGIAALGATALFAGLETRRAGQVSAPMTPRKVGGEAMIVPPAPLSIPAPQSEPAFALGPYAPPSEPIMVQPLQAAPSPVPRAPPRIELRSPRPDRYEPRSAPAAPQVPPSGPALVYQAPSAQLLAAPDTAGQGNQRVQASRLANPSTTIPQGAVIQAVLETALDSTRPGSARAIVSRDVRGFDGTRVLIPRGSRLYGEYKADLSPGQNRALIQWTRLIRPDGAVIELDSPSADQLGRAGVKGKVNSHFLARFGGALLQSTLNLGVGLASRGVTGGTVILGLPGSSQTISPQGDSVRPTLKVAQGTPVSVFVARDLDFTRVEQ